MEDTGRTRPSELTETKAPSTGLAQAGTMSSYGFQLSVLMGLLSAWTSGTLTFVPSLGLFSFFRFALFNFDVALSFYHNIFHCFTFCCCVLKAWWETEREWIWMEGDFATQYFPYISLLGMWSTFRLKKNHYGYFCLHVCLHAMGRQCCWRPGKGQNTMPYFWSPRALPAHGKQTYMQAKHPYT